MISLDISQFGLMLLKRDVCHAKVLVLKVHKFLQLVHVIIISIATLPTKSPFNLRSR